MIKFTIPTLLIATVIVAGIFAFVPIEQASTVHTTIQNSQLEMETLELVDVAITSATDEYTIACNGEMVILAIDAVFIGTDTGDEEFGVILMGGETVLAAQADGALSVGSNELLTGGAVGGQDADDLVIAIATGTYTDNTLVMKATILHDKATDTCGFTETA